MKKKIRLITGALTFVCLLPVTGRAQSATDCIEQLILDYQKLAGLKDVLSEMYNGYKVLSQGYGAVKSVSQGNFSLHQAFLDGLLLVSPTVRKYPRAADIIGDQVILFRVYKNAEKTLRRGGQFSPEEIRYIRAVHERLADASLQNLDALTMVMSDSKLRMSDAERLAAIDRIYLDSRNQLNYLQKFNDQAVRTARLRSRSAEEKQMINSLYGINR